MWPLSLVLLFATAAPQQAAPPPRVSDEEIAKLFGPKMQLALQDAKKKVIIAQQDLTQKNLCFTMRSYYFQRQDGQAPVLVGTATCTPANKLQQKQVSPEPGVRFVPLSLQGNDQKPED
jgi:hypothetical protein